MELKKFEYLIDAIEELKDLSQEMAVIVEGKKDEAALRDIGVEGEIFRVQTSPSVSVVEFCDSIAARYKEVILFTDLDEAGKKIGKSIKKYLTDKGTKVNENLGKKIMHALDTSEAESVSKRLLKAYRRFGYP